MKPESSAIAVVSSLFVFGLVNRHHVHLYIIRIQDQHGWTANSKTKNKEVIPIFLLL